MWAPLLLSLAITGADEAAVAEDLSPGVKIMAGDEAIDVEIGHAAPWYADLNGDGANDLLVGQFGGGKLRIYRNEGTNAAPQFSTFEFLQAGGAEASVPFG